MSAAPKAAASATKPQPARGGGGGSGGAKPAAGGGATRKPAGGGGAQPLPPHLQHSHDAPDPAGGEGVPDDPAPFESELRSRERQYGASHPAVAESCSNLAILYNQRGEVRRRGRACAGRAQGSAARPQRARRGWQGTEASPITLPRSALAGSPIPHPRPPTHTPSFTPPTTCPQYSRAQPLYERALAIYEATYGPDHQEVAHTLTDLAVLHLEQVGASGLAMACWRGLRSLGAACTARRRRFRCTRARTSQGNDTTHGLRRAVTPPQGEDEVGRPLLERALAIQERALGLDHPDVAAIRDVLNSE